MPYIGLFKRFFPFAVTLAVGLFIASFFTSIVPNFNFSRGERRKCREMQRLKMENNDLMRSNMKLRRELEDAQRNSPDVRFPVEDMPSFESDVPPPPPPPRIHRHNR